MTNHITSSQPALAADDPRAVFTTAARIARTVIDGVRPDQMTLPTVCPEHDVRSMLGHMLTVFRRITALGNGDDPMAMPDAVTGIADEAWSATFADAAHRVQAAWSDSAKLQQMMTLPWATAPGAGMLASYTSELTVHTWDLARATGQAVEWDEPTVQVALATALRTLPTGDREAYFAELAKDPRFSPELQQRPPFRNAVTIADDAPALDRLIAWYGRNPVAA